MSTAQREYNLCPGCGKTSSPYRGGWKHGGIEWHDDCLGRPSLMTKQGIAAALDAAETKQDELAVMDAYMRLKANSGEAELRSPAVEDPEQEE